MKLLKQWLKDNGKTGYWLSKRINWNIGYIYRILEGHQKGCLLFWLSVSDLTGLDFETLCRSVAIDEGGFIPEDEQKTVTKLPGKFARLIKN